MMYHFDSKPASAIDLLPLLVRGFWFAVDGGVCEVIDEAA